MVIAIIAILAALLLSVLQSARMQAVRIQCVSNEKQLILAWSVYSTDNNENLALNGGDDTVTSSRAHLWAYGGDHNSPNTQTNSYYLTGSSYALFAKSVPDASIFKCPADSAKWPLWSLTSSRVTDVRSYSMNCYIGTAGIVVPPIMLNAAYKVFTKSSQFGAASPAGVFVFMDVNPASLCTPAFGVDMSAQTWVHYPSYQHQGQGVLAYADGHVVTHKWKDPRTRPRLTNGQAYIQHNVSSPNNPDLTWLVAQTTTKK